MSSSMLMCYGDSIGKHEDISFLRLTPLPGDNYRCPVSTPANFTFRPDNFVRSKTLPSISLQQPSAASRPHRYTSHRGIRRSSLSRASPKVNNSFEISFVDKKTEAKETHQSHWLESLCSQPVDEILNKYRRKSDFIKTQKIMSKSFLTPGEKSLLSAWENNISQGQYQKVHSNNVGGARPTGNDESHCQAFVKLQHQRFQHFKPEQQFRDIIGVDKRDDGKESTSYLRNIKVLNGFLHSDSHFTKKGSKKIETFY